MITKKYLLLFLSLTILINISLYADIINLSQSNVKSEWPAIAVNSAGEIMVVWTEWESPGQMYYRIFKNGQWSNMTSSQIVSQWAWSNQLAVDSYGTFHVSYADGYGSHGRDIYYSYYTESNWATAERIYYSPYNSAWNKMDIDTNNDIHVIWYHSHVPKGQISSDIVTMGKTRMGDWPSNYENISNSASLESIHPAISVRNGNIYSCWMEGANPRKIYFSEKTGGSWKTPQEIVGSGYYPDMDLDTSGNVHIVYSNWGGNFYYISRENGTWSTTEVLSNGNAPLQFGDIKHKNNIFFATWIQGSNENWSVYTTAKIIGEEWMTPIKVADAPGGSDGNKHVQVFIDSNNCAHFVWEGIGVGGEHDIFYEKVSLFEATKTDLLGTWDGQGVFYRNSDTGSWVKMAIPAELVASGDLDGDGRDDLLGIWSGQEGVWVKYSSTGSWKKLSSTATDITTGDMNGDGRADLLGSWNGQGVYYKDSISGTWVKMASFADMIASGDLDGDGTDDLIGLWPAQGGVWVKFSTTGAWEYLPVMASNIASGDMNGDGRDDLLGTLDGDGVYYIDPVSYTAVKMANPADLIAAGDLDGDWIDDLLGVWLDQGGIWVKYSSTGTWEHLTFTARDIDAGKMRGGAWSAGAKGLTNLLTLSGEYTEGPGNIDNYQDISSEGPGGWNFVFQTENNLIPQEKESDQKMKTPGPGEPGFRCVEQRNLVPHKRKMRKKERK